MKPTNKQLVISAAIVFCAAALMAYMCYAYTSPFNGVEMRAYVKSNEQLNEYAQVDGYDWVIDVTDSMHYTYGKTKTVAFIFPGSKVGIIGVMYDMSKIRTESGIEGWVPSVFLVTDPSLFPKKGE